MSKENCGCSIAVLGDPTLSLDQFLEAGGRFKFNYCQTHAAAFEMREALREIVTAFVEVKQVTGHPLRQTPTFLEICKRALSLAEGKEADHDTPKT